MKLKKLDYLTVVKYLVLFFIFLVFNNLEKDGALLFETNAVYVHDVEKMMRNTGFNDVVVIKDCFDLERFVIGKKI